MRQRNPHDYPLDVPAIPATVQPGETVDWPHPIAGFEPAEDTTPPTPESEAATDKPTPKKRAASSPATDVKE